MKTNPKILLVEDDTNIATGLQKVMRANGYDVTALSRGDTGLERALAEPFDVVVTDLKLPGLDGLELVRQLHQAKPKLPIILITAHGTTEIAIEATKWGAFDYVPKPFEVEELLDLTAKALESSRLMSEPVDMGEAASSRTAIVGKSRVMQSIYKEIGRVAATSVTVLIRGDTGTGKGLQKGIACQVVIQHMHFITAVFLAFRGSSYFNNAFPSSDLWRIYDQDGSTNGEYFWGNKGNIIKAHSVVVDILRAQEKDPVV